MVALGEIGSPSLFGPKLALKKREDSVMGDLQKNLFGDSEPSGLYSIDLHRALARGRDRTIDDYAQKFKFVYPMLGCEACCYDCSGPAMLSLGDKIFWDHLSGSTCWWLSDTIFTFARLVAHSEHHPNNLFVDSSHYLQKNSPSIKIPSSTSTVVTVARKGGHFAVLELDLEFKTVFVTDGLSRPLESWKQHWEWILSRLAVPEGVKGGDWMTLKCEKGVPKQVDGHNCGPLACARLWNIFSLGGCDVEALYSAGTLRKAVVDELLRLVSCFEKELFQVTKPVIDLPDDAEGTYENSETCSSCLAAVSEENRVLYNCCNSTFHASCIELWVQSFADSSQVFCPVCCGECPSNEGREKEEKKDEGLSPENKFSSAPNTAAAARALSQLGTERRARRELSDTKRKLEQEKQGEMMKKLRRDNIHVNRGDVVSLKVDVRDRAQHNSMGLVGIVLKTAKESGASIIAVEAGVLALRGRTETCIKCDQFVVKKNFTICRELREIREKALSDPDYMPKGRCTVADAHRKLYGSSTHLGRSKCSCKGGKCRGSCGCMTKKRPCSSLCSCHASCGNTLNDLYDPDKFKTP